MKKRSFRDDGHPRMAPSPAAAAVTLLWLMPFLGVMMLADGVEPPKTPRQTTAASPERPPRQGNLVGATGFPVREEWIPPRILNKSFWLLLNPLNRFDQYKNSPVKDEPMFKEAGVMLSAPIIEKVPSFSRLALREIELFGPNGENNIAAEAVVSADADSAQVFFPERINDADASPQNTAFSKPLKKGEENQQGWFALSFKEPRQINRVVLHHGYWNGKSFDYVPCDFRLEYKNRGDEAWREIPGTKKEDNLEETNAFAFTTITAESIRLLIENSRRCMIISIDPVEKNLHRNAPGVDLANVPFLIMPYSDNMRLHRVNLPNLEFKVKKDTYAAWKKKYQSSFLGFSPGEWDNDFNICANWKGGGTAFRKAHEMTVEIPKPSDRDDALRHLHAYFQTRKKLYFDDYLDFDCYYCWNHYALEWGNNAGCIETTGSGNPSHQLQVAFARGAARQYGKPWGWYCAYFWGYGQCPPEASPDSIGSPRTSPPAPHAATPRGGISLSLAKRDYYLSFLNGAGFLTHESYPNAFFQPTTDGGHGGAWKLSPHGETLKEWYAFIKRHPDRGASYTPIALLLDYRHGWSPNGWSGAKQNVIFYCLPMKPCDHMTTSFMYTLFPWFPDRKDNDTRLFNSPFGDLYDVLIANPPSGRLPLSNYKAAILLGDVKIDKVLADNLVAYVKGGGTLVINARQASAALPQELLGAALTGESRACGNTLRSLLTDGQTFTLSGGDAANPSASYECEMVNLTTAAPILVDTDNQVIMSLNKYGGGSVILTTPNWMIEKNATYGEKKSPLVEFLLSRLVNEVLPFRVEGDVEYGLNKVADGWLVYLINNKGVHKISTEEETLNPQESAHVTIRLDRIPKSVTELREDKDISWRATGEAADIDVDVPPGDLKIIKIVEP